jgi:RimJ/RimL family protein N-acetyltransferase
MDVFLETDRLLLRRFAMADVDLLLELDGDPEVMRYLTNGKPTPREVIERETLPRVLRGYEQLDGLGWMAAVERSTRAFVGWIGVRPSKEGEVELGYRLRRSAWGRGYATEGSRALVGVAFERFGVRRVWAQTMAVNLASRRVMEKSGLRYVRTFHLEFDDPVPGTELGEVEYALERDEWAAMRNNREQDRWPGSNPQERSSRWRSSSQD